MNDGRIKKSVQNVTTGFLYQVLMLILSFVSRTIFIYSLGTEYLGLNSIFSDVLNLLSMVDLGFGTAMAFSFYKPLAENDEKKIAALICFYKKVYNFIALAIFVLGMFCIPFLKYIVNTKEQVAHLEIYYLFSLTSVVVSYLFVYKTTLLTADQKNYKLLQINMWSGVLKTILQIVVLLITKNYIGYLFIGVAIQFLNNLAASRKTEAEYPYIRRKGQTEILNRQEKGQILANMKSVFIYKFSSTALGATDNIIISIVIGTAMVGIYSNYLMISNKLLLIEQIVFSALTASVGNVIAKENTEKRLQVFQALQSASFIFSGIICTAFCLLAGDVIQVWLGEEYRLSFLTVIAISLNTYLSCVLQPLWIYRDATGIYIKTKYAMLAAAVVNVVLSLLLGKAIGIAGVIFASAIARLSTYFWYEPKLLFAEYFNAKVKNHYLSILKNMLLVIAVTGIFSLLTLPLQIDSWLSLLVKSAGVVGGCSVVFLLAYFKTEGFQIIINKMTMFLKKL